MNFVHMPELDEWWGYPVALGIMAALSLLLFRWLKSHRWI
jgi:magnesium transporter